MVIKDFNIIRNDRDARGGGVAVAVRKKFKIRKINFNDTLRSIEVVGVRTMMIAGDFNAHSTEWGCDAESNRDLIIKPLETQCIFLE